MYIPPHHRVGRHYHFGGGTTECCWSHVFTLHICVNFEYFWQNHLVFCWGWTRCGRQDVCFTHSCASGAGTVLYGCGGKQVRALASRSSLCSCDGAPNFAFEYSFCFVLFSSIYIFIFVLTWRFEPQPRSDVETKAVDPKQMKAQLYCPFQLDGSVTYFSQWFILNDGNRPCARRKACCSQGSSADFQWSHEVQWCCGSSLTLVQRNWQLL